MNYIALDTCSWSYLTNGSEPTKLLDFLLEKSILNKVKIIVPEIVRDEWHKNIEIRSKNNGFSNQKSFDAEMKRVEKLIDSNSDSLVLELALGMQINEDEKKHVKDLSEAIKVIKKDIERAENRNVAKIQEIFNNHSIILKAKPEQYQKAASYALLKKAPFQERNSFADALIVFSVLGYYKENNIKNGIFVSHNKTDFCKSKPNDSELHQDLVDDFNSCTCSFFATLGAAIKKIDNSILTDIEIHEIEDFIYNDLNVNYCPVCSELEKLGEIHLSKSILFDLRKNTNTLDPKQLELFFAPKPVPKELLLEIKSGGCDRCGTVFYKCIVCHTINEVTDYNTPVFCEGCGQTYQIDVEFEDDIESEYHYSILPKTKRCEKCGEIFELEDMVENLCFNCEEEYRIA